MKNHEIEMALDHVSRGQWCSYCNPWKNQKECVKFIEMLTGKIFKQSRPLCLKGLELDGYNEELQLALEYNGEQHYNYVHFFHRTLNKLHEQQDRDKLKTRIV